MSAYVVSNRTINRIVSYLDQHGGPYLEHDLDGQPRAPAELGAALNALNVEAVHQRYPSDTEEDMPGLVGPKDYAYRFELSNKFQAYGHLICWLYQCSEGDVPSRALFRAMEHIASRMAGELVRSLAEIAKIEIPWDAEPDPAQLARLA